jgi:hypothetical protein
MNNVTTFACIAITMVASLFLVSSADAILSGDASLTYSAYDGSNDKIDPVTGQIIGRNRMSSNSLTQNYSLMYSSSAPIYNSRVGRYDVSLGYNWTAFDTKFSSSSARSESLNETRGHLMYSGEITLDPKEVPFRLNAYSRDLTKNSITSSSGSGSENFASIFGLRGEATGINDGLHVESGATLVAGVKNGMTNGYNEVLRHFPMILLDYKDTINKDLRAASPIDDRLSRLAFVSLNKKDNWFHYRHTLYSDYINSRNDYVENEIQIGTVDQYMMRRWIDFSNWIKVSTDLQFSKRKSNYQTNPIEDINLNMFIIGERKYWSVRSFSTFNRTKDENNALSYQTNLPIYATGTVSPDMSWNARTAYRNSHDISDTGSKARFTDLLAGYRVDAFKRSAFTVAQAFDVEATESGASDTLTLSGSVETTSTAKFSKKLSFTAAYSVKSTGSKSAASVSDFLEQHININVGYATSETSRIELRQSNTFTDGALSSLDSGAHNSTLSLGQYINPRNIADLSAGSKSYHSFSSITAAWNPKARLGTFITISEDIYKTSTLGVNPSTEVIAGGTFDNDAWNVSGNSKYTRGSREFIDDNSESVVSSASVKYTHSRNLDGSAGVSYAYSSSQGVNSNSLDVSQKLNYYYFTKVGVSRKLFEVNESLEYANGTSNSSRVFTKGLMLGFKYYPIRQLTLSGSAGYSFISDPSEYTLVWNSSIAANFRMLQASLDYVHGIRKVDGARENRFTGNIRRSF